MDSETVTLISLIFIFSLLIGVFVYYGLVWLGLYINKRSDSYKEYIKRKIDKLHK